MKITSKKQLDFVIQADLMINKGKFRLSLIDRIKNIIVPDHIISFLISMRKVSYYKNGGGIFGKLNYIVFNYRYHKLGERLGFSIGCDVFGYGLRIPHYGTIVVGGSNLIGNYAVLHTSICISDNKKIIGDGFYCSTGAKLTSQLILGNNISIGANSLVNKSYEGNNALIGGMPAKYIKEIQPWYIGDTYKQRINRIEELKKQYGL